MYRESKKHLREMRDMYYEHWEMISGGKGYVTREDLEEYRHLFD